MWLGARPRAGCASVRRSISVDIECLESRRLMAAVTAASADAFVESVGLNGGGGNTLADFQNFRNYGFRHVRTALVRYEDPNWVATHNQAHDQLGLRWLMTINKEPTPADLVARFKQYTPGSIALLEGNNEVDNTAFYGNGYEQVARNAQAGYWDALKADTATRDTPLAIYSTTFSDWHGFSTTKADLGNIHYYPGPLNPPLFINGYNDFFTTRHRMDAALDGPEKGFIVGEAGYSAYRFGPMSRAAQAKADSMMIADYFKQGVPRTYVFSFYGSNEGFELYNQPAGAALSHILGTLGDATWNNASNLWNYPSFNPGTLDFTLTGGNDALRSQLLQKSNGDFYLLLWQSRPVSNSSGGDINNPDVNVTLNFNTALGATAVVHRMTPGTGAYSTSNVMLSGSAGSQSMTIGVPDSLLMIKLDPTSSNPFAQTGTIHQEIWKDVGGTAVADIPTGRPPDQINTLGQLEGTFSGDNYASRTRGYITAPADGLYTFWVSGDDNVELRLSRLPDQARDLETIATVPGWTDLREWHKYGEQKSVPIALMRGRKYFFEVVHKEGGGGDSVSVGWARPGQDKTAPSEVIPGSVLSPAAEPLPAGWTSIDVGGAELAGAASESGDGFSLSGNGSDIWNSADQFHFAYQRMSGDGSITARVTAQQNTFPWAKAGLMLRDGTAASARFVAVVLTASNGVQFLHRGAPGENAQDAGLVGGLSAPVWLRLTRSGNAYSAFYSHNGTTWTQVGQPVNVSLPATANAGLAVTTHNTLTTGTADFAHVAFHATVSGVLADPAPLVIGRFNRLTVGRLDVGPVTLAGRLTIAPGDPQPSYVDSLSVSEGGVLDIGEGPLVIDYTGQSPIAELRQWIREGITAGTGIVSASLPPGQSLALIESSSSASPVVVDGTAVVITRALTGDINLDGVVGFDDLGTLLGSYGQAGLAWADGDLDHSGVVDFEDLGLLLGNYGVSTQETAPTLNATSATLASTSAPLASTSVAAAGPTTSRRAVAAAERSSRQPVAQQPFAPKTSAQPLFAQQPLTRKSSAHPHFPRMGRPTVGAVWAFDAGRSAASLFYAPVSMPARFAEQPTPWQEPPPSPSSER